MAPAASHLYRLYICTSPCRYPALIYQLISVTGCNSAWRLCMCIPLRLPEVILLLFQCMFSFTDRVITEVKIPELMHQFSVSKRADLYLQLARVCVPLMESGMTAACWTDVWVSCCHAGGSRICWVPLGQACCRERAQGQRSGKGEEP